MAKTKKDRITLEFGGRYRLMLTDTQETMGHDDSLPYNTRFTLYDNVTEACSGRCWNDGWGGESEILIEQGEVTQAIEGYIQRNFRHTFNGQDLGGFRLVNTIDAMACLYLDNPSFHGKTCPEQVFKTFIR